MKDYEARAKELFREGYNCSQAVVLAFSDVTGLDERTSAMLASSFGGGMGRLREVCGAVSGAFAVLGLVLGYDNPEDKEAKKTHYALIQETAAEFRSENGSIICRELLGLEKPGADTPVPEERTEGYYHRRPCESYVGIAARITERLLREHRKL